MPSEAGPSAIPRPQEGKELPPLILLVGPTAVGKTVIALGLAEHLGGEIVSADSRLFYRGMDVGTAKPTKAALARVPHHLINIADPDETVSLAVFQALARQTIADIHGRGRIPLLVGGTGQYVRAVTEGWQPPPVRPHEKLRLELGRLGEQRGPAWLHHGLQRLDPEAAGKIDVRNMRRTVRALEVILTSGHRFSDGRRIAHSPYRLLMIGLRRPRAELYARLDARIEDMFKQGLLDEVRRLLAKGYATELPSMSAIGYRECIRVVQGQWDLEGAKAEMRRLTRILVRRQSNWFKEVDPNIKWFDAAQDHVLEDIESFARTALNL